ncbi:MAG: hypothetical protein QOI61_145 [Actinomycetota bacterium]|jgi:glycosyltransferase involved in cell wall biosynthesis
MRVAVVVTTYNRAEYLPQLIACLDAQTLPRDEFEVIIVDNGSIDDTPALNLTALRLDTNRGPGGGRNAGAALVTAPIIAITDDDCLPSRVWLERLLAAFDDPDVVVAQGRVEPDPEALDAMGPFDHTISVHGPTPFFETCNVAYRRDAFERVGGFDEHDPLLHPKSGRAFGEDACLGAAVLPDGGRHAFVEDALVIHRCVPRTFGQWLADQRQLRLFPGLTRRTPLLKKIFVGGVFLNRTTAYFDLAVLGVVASIAFRLPEPILLALPWIVRRGRMTRWFAGNNLARGARIFAKYAVSDAVTFLSLLQGSLRYGRLLL